jgi:hypothetical protein
MMKHILKEATVLNGPMLIYVKESTIYIHAYEKEFQIPFNPSDTPPDIKGVAVHIKDPYQYTLTSDIFDTINYPYHDTVLTEANIHDTFVALLEASIQFIATISHNEDTAVLVQNTFSEDKGYFMSTIGLVDDTRILFAHIKPKESEK